MSAPDKARFDLIPAEPLEEIAAVLQHGLIKHGERGWLSEAFTFGRFFAAMMRHAWKWWAREDVDLDSGCSHLAHVAANALILRDLQLRRSSADDRPPVPSRRG